VRAGEKPGDHPSSTSREEDEQMEVVQKELGGQD